MSDENGWISVSSEISEILTLTNDHWNASIRCNKNASLCCMLKIDKKFDKNVDKEIIWKIAVCDSGAWPIR